MILEGMFGIIAALYLIVGLFLAMCVYMRSPCSFTDALLIIFFWPLFLLIWTTFAGKKKEEDCGC